jgi:ribosome-associated protein
LHQIYNEFLETLEKKQNTDQLLQTIIEAIQDKKGEEVTYIDLKDIPNAVASYFVICSGGSDTQVDAIATEVEKAVSKKTGQSPWQSEGKTNREWILLDYAYVVVHIFKKSIRSRYALEDLWGDASITKLED